MNRIGLIALLVVSSALAQFVPKVRMVHIETIRTSEKGLPEIPTRRILDAFRASEVGLRVEGPFDLAAVERAKAVLEELYRQQGSSVRVEYRTEQMPPRSVGVSFRVIELCGC